uniref:G domain-containing protein n=1 Tax=Macrostomum lignano TaxID=282301 RepID=A0A1I8F7Z2_9PLAT
AAAAGRPAEVGIGGSIVVGRCRYPNTGKSSLINSLKRARVAHRSDAWPHTRRMGKLKRGGLPEQLPLLGASYDKIKFRYTGAKNDWSSGRLTYYTLPPENPAAQTASQLELVGQCPKEFSLDTVDLLPQRSRRRRDSLAARADALDTVVNPLESVAMATLDDDNKAGGASNDAAMETDNDEEESGGRGGRRNLSWTLASRSNLAPAADVLEAAKEARFAPAMAGAQQESKACAFRPKRRARRPNGWIEMPANWAANSKPRWTPCWTVWLVLAAPRSRSSQRDAKYSLNSAGPPAAPALLAALMPDEAVEKLTPKQISDQIDEQIKQDKRRRRATDFVARTRRLAARVHFLRSLRIIHKDQFDEREVRSFQAVIYANVWRGIMKLLFIKKQLGIKWESSKPGIAAVKIYASPGKRNRSGQRGELQHHRGSVPPGCAGISHPLVRQRRTRILRTPAQRVQGDEEFRDVGENLDYYLNQLDSIAMPGYRPTEAHILHSRRFTDSVFEKPLIRKWAKTLRVFRGELQSVIYIIACSTFNEFYTKPATGELINKLDESFDCLRHLLEIKTELFTPDMIRYQLRLAAVTTPTNLGHVREHLLRRLNVVLNASLQLKKYTHFTTSIDLSNVRRVFKDVQDTVMHNFHSGGAANLNFF